MNKNSDTKDFCYNLTELCYSDLKIGFIIDDMAAVANRVSPVHMHSFWELFYVKEGSLIFTAENDGKALKSGQLLLVPPTLYHATAGDENTRKFSIFFSLEKQSSKEEPLYDSFAAAFSKATPQIIEDGHGIGSLMCSILRLNETKTNGADFRMKALITELLFQLHDKMDEVQSDIAPVFSAAGSNMVYKYAIERLMDYYYDHDISLEFLSEKLFVSPKTVTRMIASAYGKSFQELKTELKMRNAKKMLTETKMSIHEIAIANGYTTTRGFLTAFRKYEGISPTEYRKSH